MMLVSDIICFCEAFWTLSLKALLALTATASVSLSTNPTSYLESIFHSVSHSVAYMSRDGVKGWFPAACGQVVTWVYKDLLNQFCGKHRNSQVHQDPVSKSWTDMSVSEEHLI